MCYWFNLSWQLAVTDSRMRHSQMKLRLSRYPGFCLHPCSRLVEPKIQQLEWWVCTPISLFSAYMGKYVPDGWCQRVFGPAPLPQRRNPTRASPDQWPRCRQRTREQSVNTMKFVSTARASENPFSFVLQWCCYNSLKCCYTSVALLLTRLKDTKSFLLDKCISTFDCNSKKVVVIMFLSLSK